MKNKIPKIQFLFNIQNFDTKMFVKALATNKKFSNIFFWRGGNESNIKKNLD